eukprot:s3354_g3.t1
MAEKYHLQVPFETWSTSCSDATNLTFFVLEKAPVAPDIKCGAAYELKGTVQKKPSIKRPAALPQASSASEEIKKISCPFTHCCICHGPLHAFDSIESKVYNLLGVETVEHAIQFGQVQHMLPEDAQISKWYQYYAKASIILNVLTEYTLMTSSQTLEQRLKLLQSIDLDEPRRQNQLAKYSAW